ncbi:MAG: iron-sulfur cluster assembly accessory protein [Clostridia bacterium]|nr:iron-sulfur cluster assembly accessory protein [Clostridia bacterium]
MFSLTSAASERLRKIMEEKQRPDLYLRVYVAPGGCCGYNYGMSLEEAPEEGDLVFEDTGIRCLVDPDSAPLLEGATVDYVDSLMGGGFTIQNPNAVSSCHCGHSFRTAGGGGSPSPCSR